MCPWLIFYQPQLLGKAAKPSAVLEGVTHISGSWAETDSLSPLTPSLPSGAPAAWNGALCRGNGNPRVDEAEAPPGCGEIGACALLSALCVLAP